MCNAARAGVLAVGLIGCSSITLAVGPEWGDDLDQDAGSLPESSQRVEGEGDLTKINGTLGAPLLTGDVDTEDMYLINITNPDEFVATTTFNPKNPDNPGTAQFNTTLWLFEAGGDFDGRGLLANKTAFSNSIVLGKGGDSTLRPTATDETRVSIRGKPGLYYLAISFDGRFCTVGDDFIFDFNDGPGEISGWDGPADNDASVTAWDSELVLAPPRSGAFTYSIAFHGVEMVPASELALSMDVKPGGCPNSFNRNSNGVLPVSLLGTSAFDVEDINLSTVVLARTDGVGGDVAPHEGPPGPHSVFDDTGTPFSGAACDCHELDGDGFIDLSMKFDVPELVEALQLNDLPNGALVSLKLSGQLNDGTAFSASDCIRLVPPGTPPGQLAVEATIPGAWIDVSPPDLQLDGGGYATFQRTFPMTTAVTLQASPTANGRPFMGWMVNGSLHALGQTTLTVEVTGSTQTVKAVYRQ